MTPGLAGSSRNYFYQIIHKLIEALTQTKIIEQDNIETNVFTTSEYYLVRKQQFGQNALSPKQMSNKNLNLGYGLRWGL